MQTNREPYWPIRSLQKAMIDELPAAKVLIDSCPEAAALLAGLCCGSDGLYGDLTN